MIGRFFSDEEVESEIKNRVVFLSEQLSFLSRFLPSLCLLPFERATKTRI